MRLDNDIPRDSCQGCLNTTQKQLLLRAGDHFTEVWEKAESASKCLCGALRGAGWRLILHNILENICSPFFNSKTTRYPHLASIAYTQPIFLYFSLILVIQRCIHNLPPFPSLWAIRSLVYIFRLCISFYAKLNWSVNYLILSYQ